MPFPLAPAVATFALLVCPWSDAADWKVAPTVALSETYTDNLRLAPAAAQKSDTITEVAPGIAIIGTGPKLKFHFNYSMQNLAYAHQTSKVTTNNLLHSDAKAELLKELFFLDGAASITQQNILPFGEQPVDNKNLSGNRTEVRTTRVSPYLHHRFGSFASGDLRYSHDAVASSGAALQSTQTDAVQLNLASGAAFHTIGWGIKYSDSDMEHRNSQPVSMQTTSGSLSYLVSPRFHLTADSGYEKNSYVSLGQKPQGAFWSTGFSWNPSLRTSISASTGHRYYGKTYSLSTTHRSRHSVWSIGYNEDVTTTQAQFMVPPTTDTSAFLNTLWLKSVPDPEARQQMVDSFIRDTGLPTELAQGVNTFSNRVFLQKRLQASVALNGAKNSLVFNAYSSLREALSSPQSDITLLGSNNTALTDEVRQTGANAVWSWHMTPRTNFNVNTGYTKSNSIATGRIDKNKSVRVAIAKSFQQKLKGTVEVRHVAQDSNLGNSYRENAVTASLSLSL